MQMTKTSPKKCKCAKHNIIRLFLVVIIVLFSTDVSNAEGTKQTTATSNDRTHLLMNFAEYNDFGRYNGTVDQRLFIHIENPETEVVYFGFSTFYSQPHWPQDGSARTGYFRIKDPSGNVVWPTAGDPAGQQNNSAIASSSLRGFSCPLGVIKTSSFSEFTDKMTKLAQNLAIN